MKYVRYCELCGGEKIYSSLDSYRANKNNKLCRGCASKIQFKKLYPNKLEKLLEDTPESYYWIGYLLSDGHFDNNTRIKFTQSNKDIISIENFVKYIESSCSIKYKNNTATFDVMSHDIVPQITKKFDIKSSKTYSPPNIQIFKNMDIELLAYLFIGFVDGDGHIGNLYKRKDFNLRIKLHASWLNILKNFGERLFGTSKCVKINNQGYAELTISNTKLLKQFKRKYFENITFEPLHRKWDVIDLNYMGKVEYAEITFQKVKELYYEDYTPKEICEKLNLKECKVYKDLRKIKCLVKSKNK